MGCSSRGSSNQQARMQLQQMAPIGLTRNNV